jgi:site-specific recombinase XerD
MMRPSSEPTFITLLARAGIELYKVKRLLGHKSPVMTQCYAHHYPEGWLDHRLHYCV